MFPFSIIALCQSVNQKVKKKWPICGIFDSLVRTECGKFGSERTKYNIMPLYLTTKLWYKKFQG